MEKVSIELSEEEAAKFLKFQEHYDLFSVLLDGGAFNTRSGYVSLMFNGDGRLMEIRKEIRTYHNQKT